MDERMAPVLEEIALPVPSVPGAVPGTKGTGTERRARRGARPWLGAGSLAYTAACGVVFLSLWRRIWIDYFGGHAGMDLLSERWSAGVDTGVQALLALSLVACAVLVFGSLVLLFDDSGSARGAGWGASIAALVGLTLAAGLVWYGASQTSDVVAQERLIVLGPWAAGLLLVVVLPGLALASAAWHGRPRTRDG